MSWEDYVDMALYFRWCEKEKEMVFYEMNTGKADFLDVIDAAYSLNSWFNAPQMYKGNQS